MEAILIVVLTLMVLGGVLFGTDHLDRRLGGGPTRAPVPGEGRGPPAGWAADVTPAARDRHTVTRPAPPCSRRAATPGPTPGPVLHGRIAGPNGPIAVGPGPRPSVPLPRTAEP